MCIEYRVFFIDRWILRVNLGSGVVDRYFFSFFEILDYYNVYFRCFIILFVSEIFEC